MKKSRLCLFGGALLGAGLSQASASDITVNGHLNMISENWRFTDGYHNIIDGYFDIDFIDFTVSYEGYVIIDMLSYEMYPEFFDDHVEIFMDDGGPLTAYNWISAGSQNFTGSDTNGSTSDRDVFLEIFMEAGDYTIAISAGDFGSDINLGVGHGEIFSSNQSFWPTIGTYQLDITLPPFVCLVDSNGDGVLDFFDISAFLTCFVAQEQFGDFNGDGTWDFFDISAFLTVFMAGCP